MLHITSPGVVRQRPLTAIGSGSTSSGSQSTVRALCIDLFLSRDCRRDADFPIPHPATLLSKMTFGDWRLGQGKSLERGPTRLESRLKAPKTLVLYRERPGAIVFRG